MRDAGFTVVELMVSLVVVLLVAAGTAAVITYQSRLGVYRVKATNAQQAVETALVLIRNDMMQAGGTTSGVWWDAANKRLFIKYNGFLNFEAPSIPSQNCTLVRSVFCPSDCANNKCGAAWQIVDSDGSFTMDRFPPYVAYNLATQASAFFGAINVSSNDCQTLLGASVLKSVTEVAAPNPYHTLKFVPSPSFVAGSYASPAIVYQLQSGSLLRNGAQILGGDISLTSFNITNYSAYSSVSVAYTWTPPFSFLFQPVSSNQQISVGMLNSCFLRQGD